MANKAIVGEKVGMTQVWDEDNRVLPVTVLRVRPNRVVQVKTTERDGYTALQVTVGRKDMTKLTRPEAGHFAAGGGDAGERLVELRLDRLDHLRMREADLVNIVAVKIQEATALKVLDVGALAMGQDIEAGSRKRLVQKKAAILRQELPGFFVEILLYPFQPPGREVDVAL